ncbi:DNA polymerase III alpha subunit [Burkholderia ambifaria]|nr:DNA polymerase III alpha subunit [Burkholderia ambifaria]
MISRGKLTRLVPVENAAMEDRTIIQWDKDDIEALGILKIDVLALGMLSMVRRALDMISEKRGETFELQDIPAEDKATYDMLGRVPGRIACADVDVAAPATAVLLRSGD